MRLAAGMPDICTIHRCRYTRDELEMIDNQGRCVMTDHGAFVLFNVYGPAVTSELNERFAFKMRFYQVRSCSSSTHAIPAHWAQNSAH